MHPFSRTAVLLALLAACGSVREPRTDTSAAGADTTIPVTTLTVADTTAEVPPCAEPCRTRDEVAGDYVLVEMDGKPLPHSSRFTDPDDSARRCTSIIDGGIFTLWSDGTFRDRTEGRIWCSDMRRPDASSVDTLQGTFRTYGPRGDSIAMGVTAIDPPVRLNGVFVGDELHVVDVSDVRTPRSAFRYVRQRP